MKRKSITGRQGAFRVPVLLVGETSAGLDRTEAMLQRDGAIVTRADNVCHAEVYAEQQYFEAAVYAGSLSAEEQISLARIMRVRWPWMKLVRFGVRSVAAEPGLFDCQSASESELPDCLQKILAGSSHSR